MRLITWGRESSPGFVTINLPGYSPIAIVFAIICGGTIVLATAGFSLRPTTIAIPQIGTCSVVVSAACHPPEGNENAAFEEVQWGVVAEQDRMREGGDNERKERCCVTSQEVTPPIDGKSY